MSLLYILGGIAVVIGAVVIMLSRNKSSETNQNQLDSGLSAPPPPVSSAEAHAIQNTAVADAGYSDAYTAATPTSDVAAAYTIPPEPEPSAQQAHAPTFPESVRPEPVGQVAQQDVVSQVVYAQPPGTARDLDDHFAVRPEIDEQALTAARAAVSDSIPDEVLKDVLLDATPEQAAQLFSGVSQQVMAGAIGTQTTGVHFEGQALDEDLAKLSSLSSAVDDLDIWNFGEDPKVKA